MEFIIIFFIVAMTLFLVFNKKDQKVKNKGVKKEEIIAKYEKDLKRLLHKYGHDKNEQIKQKKTFLQNCNSELARNIFFTHEESVKIIQRLSLL